MQQHHAKGIVALSCLVIVGVIASLIFSSLSSNVNDFGGQPTPRGYLPNVSSMNSPSTTAAYEILPNSSAYVDTQGQLHVVGEVHNWAGSSWDFTVQANILDASAHVIDHGNGGQNSLSLLPNAVGCFDVILPIAPPGWATYTLSVSQSTLGYIAYAPLDAGKVSAQNVSGNEYRLIGRVQNKLGAAVNQVYTQSTLYNKNGRVIGCHPGVLNSTIISSTASTYFVSHFTDYNFTDVASSSVVAYGVPIGSTYLCNSSSPYWLGSNPAYPFCAYQELSWEINEDPLFMGYHFDNNVSVKWDISGINGVWLIVDGNSDKCGPSGASKLSAKLDFRGTYSWNIKDWDMGGYIARLYVQRSDDTFVYFGKKYLCIGFDGSGPTSTAQPVSTWASTATATSTPPLPPTAVP